MTALRRIAPLLAPRVSSRAVGSTRPIPIRPRVSRNRYGSIFQTSFDERSLPSRVFENAAYARLNQPRGRLGSTYLTRAGIGGSPGLAYSFPGQAGFEDGRRARMRG